jgi:hypothetical protein
LIFVFKRPSFDGHVVSFEEVFKVLFIDAVVPAGQPEGFESIAFYPFQHGAFAYLTVSGDIS